MLSISIVVALAGLSIPARLKALGIASRLSLSVSSSKLNRSITAYTVQKHPPPWARNFVLGKFSSKFF